MLPSSPLCSQRTLPTVRCLLVWSDFKHISLIKIYAIASVQTTWRYLPETGPRQSLAIWKRLEASPQAPLSTLRSKPDSSHKPFLFRFLCKSVGFHLGPLNPNWGATGYPATFILVQKIKWIPGGEIKNTEPKLDGYMLDVGARTAPLCFQWYHASCFQQTQTTSPKKGEKFFFVATHVHNQWLYSCQGKQGEF